MSPAAIVIIATAIVSDVLRHVEFHINICISWQMRSVALKLSMLLTEGKGPQAHKTLHLDSLSPLSPSDLPFSLQSSPPPLLGGTGEPEVPSQAKNSGPGFNPVYHLRLKRVFRIWAIDWE